MAGFLKLEKYSLGVGDRFGRQAKAQLRACMLAAKDGVEIVPVWNKSNREHMIIGSDPANSRRAAEAAVKAVGWTKAYHVDADHIRLDTVERFLPHADFFTLDVADSIGPAEMDGGAKTFTKAHPELVGKLEIPGVAETFRTTAADVEGMARKYLLAIQEAGTIYKYIATAKEPASFITEVSMDETDTPQTPLELLVILAGLADQKIPLQTIAPKFTGRFNKGVDYVGDLTQFEKEFQDDLAVIALAVRQYGLPAALKLSVHSGSDKFSIYDAIRRGMKEFDAGLHLKTAGTTWLEELIGLAEAGGRGLQLAKRVYAGALEHRAELCGPYASVIDIDAKRLPSVKEVNGWSSEQFIAALRHDKSNPNYNRHVRQLLHVGYKLAAKMGNEYLQALDEHEEFVSRNVTRNLYDRHIVPLFVNGKAKSRASGEEKALYEVA